MKKSVLLLMVLWLCSCSSEDPCRSCGENETCFEGRCVAALSDAVFAVTSAVDVLFIVDNSGSMVSEQKQLGDSFALFAEGLQSEFGDQYHLAVVTTGMESKGCPLCTQTIMGSCLNGTGENGRFQDRLGYYEGTEDSPDYLFTVDSTCRVTTPVNRDVCFFNPSTDEGTVLVGINGCGYERGLAAIRAALSEELLRDWNGGFLRDDAKLVVVVVSDEEDCGEVGDVSEGVNGAMGNICYFASKGIDGEGDTSHANDPDMLPYALTPVEDYYDHLMSLKDDRPGMVKFAAVVGVQDVNDPSATTIEYEWDSDRNMWGIQNACSTPGCTGHYCFASPGTRYIQLAQMFGPGDNGLVDTICQTDFSDTLGRIAGFLGCPDSFPLSGEVAGAGDLLVAVNGEEAPAGSWDYIAPYGSPDAPHGEVKFKPEHDPCAISRDGEVVRVGVIKRSVVGK